MYHCLPEGLPPRLVFDRTVSVKQLSVVEAHGLLLLRRDKGRGHNKDFDHAFLLISFM